MQRQGFVFAQDMVDIIEVIECEAFVHTKGYPNIHIMTQADQVVDLANEDVKDMSVNSLYQTGCGAILQCILHMTQ